MRRALVLAFAACTHAAPPPIVQAPQAPDPAFAPLQPLFGHWQNKDGELTLEPDLGGKVVVRKSRNEGGKGHHEDVTVIFPTPTGLRASYWDNEGHVISYAVTATAQRVELVSDEVAGQPRFRLRYDIRGKDELAIDFAIAQPGADFQRYTGGTVHRR